MTGGVDTRLAVAPARSFSEDSRHAHGATNTPLSNTGGILQDVWEDSEELLTDGADIWLKCKQRQSKGLVHVDWLSFSIRTIKERVEGCAWKLAERLAVLTNGEISEGNGAHFYARSLKVHSADTMLAIVYFSGEHQRNTVHVAIPGAAWLTSDFSFNQNIYDLLVEFGVEHLSRIDLARDCFDGESNFAAMVDAFAEGKFKPSRGVSPSIWTIQDERRGSTCHVGRRENGKLIRGYEKSMQLARKDGWFRVELELRSVNRRIPLEAVLEPTAYFAGSCKYLAELAETSCVQRVATFRKSTELSVDHMRHYAKIAYGKFVKFMSDAGVPAEEIVSALTLGVSGLPRRLRIAEYNKLLQAAASAPAATFA